MININQEGRVIEIRAADVFSIEYCVDTYSCLDEKYVEQGAPESGHIREVVLKLKDGTAIVIYAMSTEHIPLVYQSDLDGEALAGALKGKPLPTAQEVAAGIAAQFERDSQTEDGDESTSH